MDCLLQALKRKPTAPAPQQIQRNSSTSSRQCSAFVKWTMFDSVLWHYDTKLADDPDNHELWLDFALSAEEHATREQAVRRVYTLATKQVPLAEDKNSWRTYIAIWIAYALYEEMKAKNIGRARRVYNLCLAIIPHAKFTFSKIWLMYTQFEQRHNNLPAARSALNRAIFMCPRIKLFQGYIEMEIELGENENSRKLYRKFIKFQPENCYTWIDFAEMEVSLGEIERAHAIYRMAINQRQLNMPELMQSAYDDFVNKHCVGDLARKIVDEITKGLRTD